MDREIRWKWGLTSAYLFVTIYLLNVTNKIEEEMSKYSTPTTVREAEKLAWMATKADNSFVRQQARETLVKARDERCFIKVYDEAEREHCLFMVPDKGRCKVASCHYDFDEDEDEAKIAEILHPYMQDPDLKSYVKYFIGG